jgi:hypothetical protein
MNDADRGLVEEYKAKYKISLIYQDQVKVLDEKITLIEARMINIKSPSIDGMPHSMYDDDRATENMLRLFDESERLNGEKERKQAQINTVRAITRMMPEWAGEVASRVYSDDSTMEAEAARLGWSRPSLFRKLDNEILRAMKLYLDK